MKRILVKNCYFISEDVETINQEILAWW